jgi:hypothetical protein
MKTFKGKIPKPKPHQCIVYGATSESRIELLYQLADKSPNREYIIPYSAITEDLPNGLTPQSLAHIYACRSFTPLNIIFEESFCELVDEQKIIRHMNKA